MPTRPRTDAVRRAQAKYDKANTRQFILKLNRNTDAEMIEYLEAAPNISGLLKQLLREHMALDAGANEPANEAPANETAPANELTQDEALALLPANKPANEAARGEIAVLAAKTIRAAEDPTRAPSAIAGALAEAYGTGHRAAFLAMQEAARATR